MQFNQKIVSIFATAFLIFGEMFSAVAQFGYGDSENLQYIEQNISDIEYQIGVLNDKIGDSSDVTVIHALQIGNEKLELVTDYLFEIEDHAADILSLLRYIRLDVEDIEEELKDQSDLMKESHKTVRGISNEVSRLSQTVRRSDGISYLLVSNLNTQAVSPIDLSILTNSILGSAYLSPWSMVNGIDYYHLLAAYKNGEIDPEIFIAEMGLYNWLAGLNFGDWFVTTPDSEDMEDMSRWGIVERAKMEWEPLAGATAFSPYEISDARYFLYGTRDLTDLSYSNSSVLQSLYSTVTSIKDSLINDTDPGDLSSSETPPTNLSQDFPEIPEEVPEEKIDGIEYLLASKLNLDSLAVADQALNKAISSIESVNTSAEGSVVFPIELSFLGIDHKVSIQLDKLEAFTSIYNQVTSFIVWGFKVAVCLMILGSSIKVTFTELNEMPLWYS